MSGGITLIDRTDRRMLPIGDDGFSRAARRSVIGDKAMPITSKHRRSPLPGAAGPLFLALPAGRGVILARNRADCMGRRPQSASRGRKYDVKVLLSAPSGRVPAPVGARGIQSVRFLAHDGCRAAARRDFALPTPRAGKGAGPGHGSGRSSVLGPAHLCQQAGRVGYASVQATSCAWAATCLPEKARPQRTRPAHSPWSCRS